MKPTRTATVLTQTTESLQTRTVVNLIFHKAW